MGLIEFKSVTKQYKNGVTALYDLNLDIEKKIDFFKYFKKKEISLFLTIYK